MSAVEHVIESLTPNARRIFRLLVEAFLANSQSKDYEGPCRSSSLSVLIFLVNCRNEIYGIVRTM